MSVSTAIDSSRRSDARLSMLVPDGFQEGGSPNDHAHQPPALFQRPIAAVALPPLVAADRRVSSRSATGAVGRSRSETTNVPDHARNRSSQQRPTRTGRQPIARSAPPVPQAARDLLSDATRGLGTAMAATTVADRYAAAHLAALRAAAAVLAARARPVRGRRGSAWELISKVAPEFAEWAAFFAAGSAKRQAAEAGIQRLVSPREADDMVRQVAAFLDLVEDSLRAG
jgi:hypothetical protein